MTLSTPRPVINPNPDTTGTPKPSPPCAVVTITVAPSTSYGNSDEEVWTN